MGHRRGRNKPADSVTLETYADLDAYFYAFARGSLNLMIVIAAAGRSKTRTMKAALSDEVAWISGHNSAFGIYRQLWHARDRNLIVLDDLDELDRTGVHLLKALCQSEPTKTLTWNTASRVLADEGIPNIFTTRARVCIIANDWQELNAHAAALMDRGHMVFFEPSPAETHRRVAEWYWDQEIFDFIGERLHLFGELSMRLYIKAFEAKKAGLDWRREVLSRCLKGPALLVARLKADPSFAREEDRVIAFTSNGGGCRATYFNHAKAVEPAVDTPHITLRRTTPSEEQALGGIDVIDLIRTRHPDIGHD